jgi:hypothetical protein
LSSQPITVPVVLEQAFRHSIRSAKLPFKFGAVQAERAEVRNAAE